MIKEFYRKHREVILYFFYGAFTSLANIALYAFFVPLLGITASNGVAWCGAVVFAFITNKLFVFNSRSWAWKTTLKEITAFLGARILSGIVEVFLPTVLFYLGINYDLFGIEGFLAKIIVSVVVIIMNYILSKLIVFRKKGGK